MIQTRNSEEAAGGEEVAEETKVCMYVDPVAQKAASSELGVNSIQYSIQKLCSAVVPWTCHMVSGRYHRKSLGKQRLNSV